MVDVVTKGALSVMTDRLSALSWKVVAVLAAGVVALAIVLGGFTSLWRLNPFGSDTVDRSQPALLQSIRDLSQYHAAVGDFQVVIDVEKDVRFVPSALAGQRTLFVAAGTVNAYVDFTGMSGDALVVDEQARTVEVRLPKPQLDKPNLDQSRSYVFTQQRGVFDRLGDVVGTPDQQQFYVLAEEKLAEAAQQSTITDQAERNTRSMLSGMFQALGYEVTVTTSD
jgi:hypothetical protein